MTHLCIFEDEGFESLLPLVYTRPVYALRCGMLSLLEKILIHYRFNKLTLLSRDYLKDLLVEWSHEGSLASYNVNSLDTASDEKWLFINGRLLNPEKIPLEGKEEYGHQDGEVTYVRLSSLHVKKLTPEDFLSKVLINRLESLGIDSCETTETLIHYPWDLVMKNAEEIGKDFRKRIGSGRIEGRVYDFVSILNKDEVYIGEESRVMPGCVLNAEGGPIYIGGSVTILPHATIEGPVFIGNGSKIKVGAKIYEGTSIGEVCKVGGEVEESIIHSYSNKQHDGFLGHSYIGMWCNLGAGTNNSDLKNNYSSVKVQLGNRKVDTGSLFVGLTMGDHSKSAINTMFNTGTMVGVMSNVFGGGFPPKFIPSFSWGGKDGMITHKIERALETARRVMARREKKLTPAQESVLRKVFEMTMAERKSYDMH